MSVFIEDEEDDFVEFCTIRSLAPDYTSEPAKWYCETHARRYTEFAVRYREDMLLNEADRANDLIKGGP
jgi:uncharacterized protein YeaO (DUF488 family)